MQSMPDVLSVIDPSNLLTPSRRPRLASIVSSVGEPPWKAAVFCGRKASSAPTVNARCVEKGCIFPAASGGAGKCVQHERQAREPILFSSHQPTRVVLECSRFDIPEREIDTSRRQDRRRLAALRAAFLED